MTAARPLVLVTRSEPGASATAERLAAAGFAPVLTPMLAVAPLPLSTSFEGVQAVLVTSAHAARRLGDAPGLASSGPLPRVLTVGGATADAARAAGASDVVSAEGDAKALAALARTTLDPKAGPLLHLRGRDVAADLAGDLRAAGFDVAEAVVYAAEMRAELAPEAAEALRSGAAAAVVFHSARGVRAFLEAVGRMGLEDRLAGVIAAAMSPQAGALAADAGFRLCVAAAQPLETSLVEALTEALNRTD